MVTWDDTFVLYYGNDKNNEDLQPLAFKLSLKFNDQCISLNMMPKQSVLPCLKSSVKIINWTDTNAWMFKWSNLNTWNIRQCNNKRRFLIELPFHLIQKRLSHLY